MNPALTATAAATAREALDAGRVRADFPCFARWRAAGDTLVYLDNAATTQKPQAVLDAVTEVYAGGAGNIHRGVHRLSQRATEAYEGARETVRCFLGADSADDIVFVRGATEGINLVARSFLAPRLTAGDEVVVSRMEHHANIVPWQMVCEERGARLRVIPMGPEGDLDLDALEDLLGDRTRLVAVTQVSNALGTVNPIGEIVTACRRRGVPILVDGAQAVVHGPVDVATLGCDFYVFSGHKVYGPSGVGALYARREHLESMPPYQGGGDMIRSVSFEHTDFAPPPQRFEAGTPNIEGAVGLAAALDYLSGLGLERVAAHEAGVLDHAVRRLSTLPGVHLVGTPKERAGVVSFVLDGVHPHDVGTILDARGVAVRAGHHCAQPVMDFFGLPATTRASFAVYSTVEEADALVDAVAEVQEIFA
ncbi:MAG: cysteine desulfurase [Acidobacteria bacterium]|nr:cysteine desulfurase [Acidobacteriota bacterium]